MQGVEGQWSGEMVINGIEVPLNPSVLNSLQVFNSIHASLPTLSVSFKDDGADVINSLGLGDGTKVNLILGDGRGNQTPTMVFNIVGDARSKSGYSTEIVEFNAVLDHIEWLRKIVTGSVKGNSGDAISKVAGEARLRTDIDSTNDSMVWLPNNKPLSAFARHVCERGWASDKSCMLLGVTDESVLRYKNLENIQKSSGIEFGINGVDVLQYMIVSKSHVINNITGYGSTSTTLMGDGTFKELNKVAVDVFSSKLPVSDINLNAIGSLGGRIESKPLDSGNTHQKWAEAQHQNRRIKSQYAFDVNLMIDVLTDGSHILDKASVQLISKATGRELTAVSGDYIITNRVRTLMNNRYFEKLTLTSQSVG